MKRAKMRMLLVPMVWAVLVLLLAACATAAPAPAQPAATATLAASGDEAAPEETVEESPSATPDPTPTATTEPLAAIVNGESISLEDYEQQVSRYEASMVAAGQDPTTQQGQAALEEGRQWVLDLMIEQSLINQAAAEQGVTVSEEEVDATIDSLRTEIGEDAFNEWLRQEDLTLEAMRERLRNDMIATQMANQVADTVPARGDHVHARHILVSTEEEARRVLNQLQAGGDFAALARAFSQDTSTRDLGGDLGFFPRGILTSAEVENAAFSLQPGQISDVIQSPLGYHIVQVVERAPDQEIAAENLRVLKDKAVREWLNELRASADLQVFVTF